VFRRRSWGTGTGESAIQHCRYSADGRSPPGAKVKATHDAGENQRDRGQYDGVGQDEHGDILQNNGWACRDKAGCSEEAYTSTGRSAEDYGLSAKDYGFVEADKQRQSERKYSHQLPERRAGLPVNQDTDDYRCHHTADKTRPPETDKHKGGSL
jgi:hypothetical protein